MKDWLLQKGAEAALGVWLRDYGKVRSVALNSVERWCEVTVDLNGETESIRVRADEVAFRAEGQSIHIRVGRVTASREWITQLATKFAVGREFLLPPTAAAAVRMLL